MRDGEVAAGNCVVRVGGHYALVDREGLLHLAESFFKLIEALERVCYFEVRAGKVTLRRRAQ